MKIIDNIRSLCTIDDVLYVEIISTLIQLYF